MDTFEIIDGTIVKRQEGTIHVIFGLNTVLTLEYAKKLVDYRLSISGAMSYPLYIDIRGVVSIDGQTRKFLSGVEGTIQAYAAAIHVDSPISKLFGNMFITIDRPEKPIKLFTSKAKALKWLKKFKCN